MSYLFSHEPQTLQFPFLAIESCAAKWFPVGKRVMLRKNVIYKVLNWKLFLYRFCAVSRQNYKWKKKDFFLNAWEATTVEWASTWKRQFTRLLERGINGFILLSVLIYNKLFPKISKPAYTAAISPFNEDHFLFWRTICSPRIRLVSYAKVCLGHFVGIGCHYFFRFDNLG